MHFERDERLYEIGFLWADYDTKHIKTTNMGSLFKLTYDLILKKPGTEKEFIDELRCRNGNLEITICRQETMTEL